MFVPTSGVNNYNCDMLTRQCFSDVELVFTFFSLEVDPVLEIVYSYFIYVYIDKFGRTS